MAKPLTREEKIALFEKLVATNPNAVRKGDTIPYTSLNGHMYSFINKEDMVALKLPKEKIEEFLTKYKTTLVTSYGIVQKDYVAVPDNLLQKTKELAVYFDISYRYVASLKPKLTTKPKKKS
jgi:hypothetical protein